MKTYLNRYPWLAYVIIGTILTPLSILGIYSVWHNYYDVTYVQGRVKGFSWQMNVWEYHLTTEEKTDWADEIESGNYDVKCYDAWRPVKETLENGTVVEYEIEDSFCEYKVDTWEYADSIKNSGTDKNPHYLDYPADSAKIKYEEQPGIFTVYFTTDITGTVNFNYDRETWDSFQKDMIVRIGVSLKGTVPYRPELPR